MLLHLGKAYYALEAKTMATEELLSSPSSWECDCGDPPPPLFHLPPPPKPPSMLGPLDPNNPDDCNGPWTCSALALDGGGKYGGHLDGPPPEASPEVPVPVIVVSVSMLGLFLVVAAVIFISRMYRSYKATSKKASCDLDSGDLYEDMPAAPPLLPAPLHHQHHQHPPPLRYKDELMPPPRGGLLPPTPGIHLYSPEPRPETPPDHLYHHISSAGSESCSCSTSEAPSNTLLPTHQQFTHSEEDEACSSSSHSYNSSSTATPTSSPTPVCPTPALYICPATMAGPHTTLLPPGYAAGLHYTGAGKYSNVHPNASHLSSLQSTVYAINPIIDSQHQHHNNAQTSDMVPLAQIYSPGSHIYESATLLRPNGNYIPSCSMVHCGNVPPTFIQSVTSPHPIRSFSNKFDHRKPIMVPMAYPLQYMTHVSTAPHHCMLQKHNIPIHPVEGSNQFHYTHQSHINPRFQHPTHLPLPISSSTLIPNVKLSKSSCDIARSPEDLTPTNSIPIDSIYRGNPPPDIDHIATTCLSTVSSGPNESDEYCSTIDAINHNSSHPLNQRYLQLEDSGTHTTGASDTSSSSHPSSVTVTESSSFDSSGTTSSTVPLTNSFASQRKELPPLPSRADRYRIYAQNNEANLANRSHTCKRPAHNNNNNNDSSTTPGNVDDFRGGDQSVTRNVAKSSDDLNISPVDNSRLQYNREMAHVEASNVVNNNYPYNGVIMHGSNVRNNVNDRLEEDDRPITPPEEFTRRSYSNVGTPKRIAANSGQLNVVEDTEDAIYDNCSDT